MDEYMRVGGPEDEGVYEVLWPLGRSVSAALAPTAPAPDLNGATIAELWDYRFRGDEMFSLIREEVRRLYPGARFVDYTVFGNTHGPNERALLAALPGLLREHSADLVISAVGA